MKAIVDLAQPRSQPGTRRAAAGCPAAGSPSALRSAGAGATSSRLTSSIKRQAFRRVQVGVRLEHHRQRSEHSRVELRGHQPEITRRRGGSAGISLKRSWMKWVRSPTIDNGTIASTVKTQLRSGRAIASARACSQNAREVPARPVERARVYPRQQHQQGRRQRQRGDQRHQPGSRRRLVPCSKTA